MDFREKAAKAGKSAKQQQLEDSIRFGPPLPRRSWKGELADLRSAMLGQPLLWILIGVSFGWTALIVPFGLLIVLVHVQLRNPDR
jgi:hypothetical protein